jgi:Na+-transporting methylmalonyl-CoA/oxaloacetate decarboxylase gamma subunit
MKTLVNQRISMARFIYIIIFAVMSAGLFSQEDQSITGSEQVQDQSVSDSIIFNNYTDEEFKIAVFKTIQNSNLTNPKLFLKTLEEVRRGKVEKKEREYGIDNISKEFSSGLNGWTITLSGMLVVFVGLIMILIVIHIFNFFFKDKTVKKSAPAFEPVKIDSEIKMAEEEIPEDHLVAIATAVELYKKLYLTNSMSRLTFKQNDKSVWRSVNKLGLR